MALDFFITERVSGNYLWTIPEYDKWINSASPMVIRSEAFHIQRYVKVGRRKQKQLVSLQLTAYPGRRKGNPRIDLDICWLNPPKKGKLSNSDIHVKAEYSILGKQRDTILSS